MRTTVTLDPDTAQLVQQRMREQRVSFKEALNGLLRERSRFDGPSAAFRTPTASLGPPRVELDRALRLAATLEDDDLVVRARRES